MCGKLKCVYDFPKGSSYCADCTYNRSFEYNKSHRDEKAEYQHKYIWNRKVEILTHYSNGEPVCVKCGFSDIRALSIDHILGGGGYHRKSNTIIGTNFYRWLKLNNYPEGYQVLCMNCQFIKRYNNMEG